MNTDVALAEAVEGRVAPARERLRLLLRGKAATSSALPGVMPREPGSAVPLSFAQEKIWSFEQANPGHRSYQLFYAYRVHGRLDRSALEGALARLIERHEILRSRVIEQGGSLQQQISATLPVILGFDDLSAHDASERIGLADALIRQAMQHHPDIATGPMLSAGLIRLSEDRHILLLNGHHLAADATSMQLLTRELALHYGAVLRGEPSPVPALPLQFGDYACWQRQHLQGPELARQTGYWAARLQDLQASTALPLDHARPAGGLRDAGRIYMPIASEVWAGLASLAKARRCTPFAVMLAATHLFLYAMTGETRQLIGVISSKKPDDGLALALGDFHNVSPMHAALVPALSFAEWVDAVRANVLGAAANQDLPFGMLADALGWTGDAHERHLPRLLYTHINAPEAAPEDAELTIVPLPLEEGYMTRNDLRINCHEQERQATMIWHYAKDLFERSTIQAYAAAYLRILAVAVVNPAMPLDSLLAAARGDDPASFPSMPGLGHSP